LRGSGSKSGKDITYVLMKEALRKKSCPVCLILAGEKENWIESLLYEHVNDDYMRKKIVSRGFCTRHLWDILEYTDRHMSISVLGDSLIIQDVLERQLKKIVESGFSESSWGADCILCGYLKEAEEANVKSLAKWIEEGELLSLYERRSSILCLKHLNLLLKQLKGETGRSLLDVQLAKLKKLNGQLRSLIETFDWNLKKERSYEEVSARELAATFLKGRPV